MKKFDVFLAHNSEDKDFVKSVAKQLRRIGMNPWLDVEQISPGTKFQSALQSAISNTKSAAIFIGSHGTGKWQDEEIPAIHSRAVEEGIIVIPILLPGTISLPENLLFLKERNYVIFKSQDDVSALYMLKWGITQKKEFPSDYEKLSISDLEKKWIDGELDRDVYEQLKKIANSKKLMHFKKDTLPNLINTHLDDLSVISLNSLLGNLEDVRKKENLTNEEFSLFKLAIYEKSTQSSQKLFEVYGKELERYTLDYEDSQYYKGLCLTVEEYRELKLSRYKKEIKSIGELEKAYEKELERYTLDYEDSQYYKGLRLTVEEYRELKLSLCKKEVKAIDELEKVYEKELKRYDLDSEVCQYYKGLRLTVEEYRELKLSLYKKDLKTIDELEKVYEKELKRYDLDSEVCQYYKGLRLTVEEYRELKLSRYKKDLKTIDELEKVYEKDLKKYYLDSEFSQYYKGLRLTEEEYAYIEKSL
jgi:TIR domain